MPKSNKTRRNENTSLLIGSDNPGVFPICAVFENTPHMGT
jgi:hypothetical protein